MRSEATRVDPTKGAEGRGLQEEASEASESIEGAEGRRSEGRGLRGRDEATQAASEGQGLRGRDELQEEVTQAVRVEASRGRGSKGNEEATQGLQKDPTSISAGSTRRDPQPSENEG